MTFREVAIKNFLAHIKQYLSYFFCSAFSIMIFFIYSTILFNKNLSQNEKIADKVLEVLYIPTVVLVFFSIIFISYAHSSFIKARQEEFGLFMSIGMSKKQILKLIAIENGLIAIASMIAGMATGAVFSRLFYLLVLKVLKVKGIDFYISYKSLLLTLGVFTTVFLIVILISLITAYRLQPLQLIKSRRISEKNKISSPILALIGIGMMAFSIVALSSAFASKKGMDSESFLIMTIVCLIGLYISISQFGGLLLKLSKKRKQFYYKNLTLITGIDYRFKQTKKIIFTMAIMVMITTFYCGFLAYILSTAEKSSIENNPYDISFVEPSSKNPLSQWELKDLLGNAESDLTDYKSLEILNIKELYEQLEEFERKAISLDNLNELLGSNFDLEKGFYIRLYQYLGEADEEENAYLKEDVTLKSQDLIIRLKNQDVVYKSCFNEIEATYSELLVLNNHDYEALKSRLNSSSIERLHLLNFQDWRKTWPIVNKLKENFITGSKISDYTYLKQGGSLMLFLCTFLGLFFFLASSVILSFKLFSELDDERQRYKKLSTIGIKKMEIKRNINQELRLLFFIPLAVGALLSLLYIFAFTRDQDFKSLEPLKFNLLVSSIYMIFQLAYFFIVRKIYSDKIIASEPDI